MWVCDYGCTLNWATGWVRLLICTWSHRHTYVIQTKNTQAEPTMNQCHEIQFGMRTLHCVAREKKKRKRALKWCSLCERRVMLQPGGLAERPVSFLFLLDRFNLFLASLSSSLPILFLTPSQVPFSLLFSPLTLMFEFRQNSVEWMVFFCTFLSSSNIYKGLFMVSWLPALEELHCLLDQHLSPQC